ATATPSFARYAWCRVAHPHCHFRGYYTATTVTVLGNPGKRWVFPFWSRRGVSGGLPDPRTNIWRHSEGIRRQNLDRCDRNHSAVIDRYFTRLSGSALADGCRRRLGARRYVVGDRAHLVERG